MTFGIPVDRFPTSTDCLGLKAGRHVKFLNALRNLEQSSPFYRSESWVIGGGGVDDDNDNKAQDSRDVAGWNAVMSHGSRATPSPPLPALSLSPPNMIMVMVPNPSDILFGRGKPIQMHPGNVWLGSIVEDIVPLYYKETSREGKSNVTQRVVRQVKERGGRFLKPYSDGGPSSAGGCIWIEVNDDQGQEKVATAFRSCRATQKQKSVTQEAQRGMKNEIQEQEQVASKRPRPSA